MQVGCAEIAILRQYLASLRAVNRSSGKCNTLSCDLPWRVDDTCLWLTAEFVDGGKQRRSVGYDKKPQRYAEDSVRYAVVNLKPK